MTKATTDILLELFGERICIWTLYNPDLSHLDYSLCSYFKNRAYEDAAATLEKPKQKIRFKIYLWEWCEDSTSYFPESAKTGFSVYWLPWQLFWELIKRDVSEVMMPIF